MYTENEDNIGRLDALAIRKTTGICKIEIIDSGIGLNETQQRKLFQPFIQAEVSTSQ